MRTFQLVFFFFFQAEDGIRDIGVTGVRRVLFRSTSFGLSQVLSCHAQHLREAERGQRLYQRCQARRQCDFPKQICLAFHNYRSEERRVGKEGRSMVVADTLKKESRDMTVRHDEYE